jgi:hypothetical protein
VPGGAVIYKLAVAVPPCQGPLRKLMNNCETDIRAPQVPGTTGLFQEAVIETDSVASEDKHGEPLRYTRRCDRVDGEKHRDVLVCVRGALV